MDCCKEMIQYYQKKTFSLFLVVPRFDDYVSLVMVLNYIFFSVTREYPYQLVYGLFNTHSHILDVLADSLFLRFSAYSKYQFDEV